MRSGVASEDFLVDLECGVCRHLRMKMSCSFDIAKGQYNFLLIRELLSCCYRPYVGSEPGRLDA